MGCPGLAGYETWYPAASGLDDVMVSLSNPAPGYLPTQCSAALSWQFIPVVDILVSSLPHNDLEISVAYHNTHLFCNVWVYRSAWV